jgi:glutaredoxin-like YruB-family protein
MKIKVYSTPTCPYCKLVKEFLDGQKIAYTEVNVADDSAAANEMVKLSGQMGVPVVDIDGDVIVGWNKDALEEALGKAGGAAPKAEAPKAEEKAAA